MSADDTKTIHVFHIARQSDSDGYLFLIGGTTLVRQAEAVLAGQDRERFYKLVATVAVVPAPEPIPMLEQAWALTNSFNDHWSRNSGVREHGARNRSTSVGDIMLLDGHWWVAASFGFEPIMEG